MLANPKIRRETNKFTFFENYVESWANILNILIISYEHYNKDNKKDNKSNSKSQDNSLLTNFLDMLERELCWILFQVAKILVFFEIIEGYWTKYFWS